MQTSSIKVFEERNSSYKLGDELHFNIPESVLLLSDVFLKMNIVSGTDGKVALAAGLADKDHYYKLILNEKIGAAALFKEITISTQQGQVLEQFDSYNRLANITARFADTTSETHKKQLFEGAGNLTAAEQGLLYEDTNNVGGLTSRTIEVCVPLSLSGILSNAQPFPNYLVGGLHVRILLENEPWKCLNAASIPPLWRENNKTMQNRQAGFAQDTGFRVQGVPDQAGTNELSLVRTAAEAGAAVNGAPPFTDMSMIGYVAQGSQQAFQHPFCVGQSISITNSNVAAKDNTNAKITAIAVDTGRLKITFDPAIDFSNAGPGGAVNASDAILIHINEHPDGNPELNISNVEMICETATPTQQQLESLEKLVSGKGYAFPYQSFIDYTNNTAANETVISNTIQSSLRQCKALMSVWERLEQYTVGKQNLCGFVDNRAQPKDYQWILDNLLTPNQKVSLTQYNKLRSEQGGWSQVHIKELIDAFRQCGLEVSNIKDLDGCLIVPRALARYNHTYNMQESQGETRCNINFTTNTQPLLWHNYICHQRTLIVSSQQGARVVM